MARVFIIDVRDAVRADLRFIDFSDVRGEQGVL
jgi:hypothetical protein